MCLFWSQETVLLEWVNPVYLDISYQEQIQEEFEDSSEIQLKDFLKVTSQLFSALHGSECFCRLTVHLSSGGEVQGGEWSATSRSDSVDEEGSPQ